MEILNNFGFDPILFFAQIVNFLIIFWLLKRFMYKPVLKILDARSAKIAKGIKDAEISEKKLAETIEKEEKILKKAQLDAKKLLDETIKESEEKRVRSEEETKKQVAEMIKDAKAQIKEESQIASKTLEAQVAKLAVEFLEKSTEGLFGDKEQQAILNKARKNIKK